MKNSNELSQKLSENLATHNPVKLKGLHKYCTCVQFFSGRQKASKPHEVTIIRKAYQVRRTEDNKLLCIQNGRKLPETNEGKIDVAQLQHEIALRLW